MAGNNWTKEWKPVRTGHRRMRWFMLPHGRVRIEFRDEDMTTAKREFNSIKEASEVWNDYKHGGITAKEMRSAGYV